MGDCSLNPLKFFTENCKNYRNLAKPVTPVRFYFSVKFINNTFDKLNNIYYCFLLSTAAIESHPGKQLFCYKSTSLRFKGFSWVLHLLYYIQKGTVSIERLFSDHQLFIEIFLNREYVIAYHNYHSTVCIINHLNNQYLNYL